MSREVFNVFWVAHSFFGAAQSACHFAQIYHCLKLLAILGLLRGLTIDLCTMDEIPACRAKFDSVRQFVRRIYPLFSTINQR